MQPNAQMSVRRSTGLPFACSGLMYDAVPRITPATVPNDVIVGDILESVRADGVATRFDRATGSFLAYNRDGTIRGGGVVEGVDAGGRLRLSGPDGEQAIAAGEVTLREPSQD